MIIWIKLDKTIANLLTIWLPLALGKKIKILISITMHERDVDNLYRLFCLLLKKQFVPTCLEICIVCDSTKGFQFKPSPNGLNERANANQPWNHQTRYKYCVNNLMALMAALIIIWFLLCIYYYISTLICNSLTINVNLLNNSITSELNYKSRIKTIISHSIELFSNWNPRINVGPMLIVR